VSLDAAASTPSGRERPIVRYGDPALSRPCSPIAVFGESLEQLVADMFASMRAARGVGLAANQIGVDASVFVIDCPDATGRRVVGHVVNPVLEPPSGRELEVDYEGCLSLPGASCELPRLARASVSGLDWSGNAVRLEASGLAARCLQHETDHLAGRLYIDRLPHKARRDILRAQRSGEQGPQ